MEKLPAIFLLASGLSLWALVTYWRRSRKHPPLPPGPPGDPIIGHLRIIPAAHNDLFFYELSKKYGEYFTIIRHLAIHLPFCVGPTPKFNRYYS